MDRITGVCFHTPTDETLDDITLYWLTNTAVSSARLYWESKLAFSAPKHVAIPVAVSVFPDELYAAPRSWTVRASGAAPVTRTMFDCSHGARGEKS
jgi:hypothetical protein